MIPGQRVFVYVNGNLTKGVIIEELPEDKVRIRLLDNSSQIIEKKSNLTRAI